MRIVKLLIISLFMLGYAAPSQAQIFKKLKKKIEQKIEERIDQKEREANRKTDEKIDEGLDKVEEGVKGATIDVWRGSEIGEEATGQEEQAAALGAGEVTANMNDQAPAAEVIVNDNYDFKPGENVIFSTDFSAATIGNFPGNLEFRGGNMSVVSYNGNKALRVTTTGEFAIDLKQQLPEKFTIGFDVDTKDFVNNFYVYFVGDDYESVGNYAIMVDGYEGTGLKGLDDKAFTSIQREKVIYEEMTSIRMMVDGSYAKVYVGKKRVANIPNVAIGRSSKLLFDMDDVRDKPIYITNIRIAGGGTDLYQTLKNEGRIAIHDIHFATGKADILPESSESIQQVAQLLNDHPELKILIEGHTDNTGDFDNNMELSRARAASVKSYLVEHFRIPGDRLRTMGQGSTQPIESNDTEEGRAQNRRVEIVQI